MGRVIALGNLGSVMVKALTNRLFQIHRKRSATTAYDFSEQYAWESALTLQARGPDRQVYMVCLLLIYAMATVFQLYHDPDMMYDIRRKKLGPTVLQT